MVDLVKKDDWRIKLNSYFTEVKRIPFDRNNNNCAHFIGNGLSVIFTVDVFAPYRKYKTFESQLKAIRKAGFENHVDFISSIFVQLEHPSQAKIGDIAVFESDDEIGVAVGFVFGENCFVMRENGLAIYPLINALKVFSI